jgi:hypothetical protein
VSEERVFPPGYFLDLLEEERLFWESPRRRLPGERRKMPPLIVSTMPPAPLPRQVLGGALPVLFRLGAPVTFSAPEINNIVGGFYYAKKQ